MRGFVKECDLMANKKRHKRKAGMTDSGVSFSLESIVIGVVVLLAVISFLTLSFGENNQVFIMIAVVVCVILFLIGVFLFNRWKQKQARKKFENAKIDRMLSKPLTTFGDGENEDEATRLAKLYQDK